LPNTKLIGLDMHIGSQLSGMDAYEDGIMRLLDLRERFAEAGAKDLRYVDVGGGLAVRYAEERLPDLERFGRILGDAARRSGLEIIVEPGRFLVGNAAVLLTRVLYRKRSGGKEYVITDAGMNDLLRPSHYRAYHAIEAAHESTLRSVVDVVGPVCESGDFFAVNRDMDQVTAGDLVVIYSVGAYGYVMASNYNARPRPVEVLVRGDNMAVITERETYEDLTRRETAEPSWRKLS
jgi:diaminopimelate decarboxylase